MKIKYPSLSDDDFTEVFLTLLSSLKPYKMRLSQSEIHTLKEFINLAPKFRSQMFSTQSKLKVIKSLNDKGIHANIAGVNVKLYSMIKKGFLKRDEDSVIVIPPTIINLIDSFRKEGSLTVNLAYSREKKEN